MYRVSIKLKKHEWKFGKTRNGVLPKFGALPNFHECFYNLIETWRACFLFLLENTTTKKGKPLVNFDYQNVNSPLLASSLCQQLVLVLCFYGAIETQFSTNQSMFVLRTVF